MSIKENSLLDIAKELLNKKRSKQKMSDIIKEVLSTKGIKTDDSKEVTAQFMMDFMMSGCFIYCGEDCWDLKERQPLSVLLKDSTDYEKFLDDEDAKKSELYEEETKHAPESEAKHDLEEDELINEFDDEDLSNEFDEDELELEIDLEAEENQ